MSIDLSKLQPSERYKAAHPDNVSVADLFRAQEEAPVILTKDEIANGRALKREMLNNPKTFANTPIYRAYHHSMVLLMQIIQLMPRKTVKISDAMLQYLSESIRWSAAAYEQKNNILKHNSIGESISLMYTVKICVNTSTTLGLIGKSKSGQLVKSLDTILRQLVAWRVSIEDKGDNGEQ